MRLKWPGPSTVAHNLGRRAFSTSTSQVEYAKAECWSMYITFLACGTYRPNNLDQIPYNASSAIIPPSTGPLRLLLGS